MNEDQAERIIAALVRIAVALEAKADPDEAAAAIMKEIEHATDNVHDESQGGVVIKLVEVDIEDPALGAAGGWVFEPYADGTVMICFYRSGEGGGHTGDGHWSPHGVVIDEWPSDCARPSDEMLVEVGRRMRGAR